MSSSSWSWWQPGWWWQSEGSSWPWTQSSDSKKPRQGGWSTQEGGWQHNPAPDGFVIRSPFPSPKLLGDGVFHALRKEAHDTYGVVNLKIRGRDSTAGRQQTRRQGTTTCQLVIVGRECRAVFKMFRKAAQDAGLEIPSLPHIRVPAELDEEPCDPLPPHPDGDDKRLPPDPDGDDKRGEGACGHSSGGGLPPTSKAEQHQGTSGGGLPATSEAGQHQGTSGGGLPPTSEAEQSEQQTGGQDTSCGADFEVDYGGSSSSESDEGELVPFADKENVDNAARPREDLPSPPLPIISSACVEAGKRRGLDGIAQQLLCNLCTTKIVALGTELFKVAFCTTSLGRNHQVRDALPLQLMTLWPWRSHVRVYFVDYNQDEELCKFIFDTCTEMLDVGFLQYARCVERKSWHASICKNGAHFWAAGWADMLVNLDGDRIIGPDLPLHIFEHLNIYHKGPVRVGHYSSTADTGTYGTIAIPTKLFIHMKGYNEEFLPCGFQDTELLQRAAAAQATVVKVSSSNCVGTSLPNDIGNDWKMQSKVKNANVDIKDMQERGKILKFGHMDQLNRTMAQDHIRMYGPVQRNCRQSWMPVAVQPLASRPTSLPPPPSASTTTAVVPAPVAASVQRIRFVSFGWHNLARSYPRSAEAKKLSRYRSGKPSHVQVREASDAVGWRFDICIPAQEYFDVEIPPAARGHLGFHDGHMGRLLTRDPPGDPSALVHIISFLRWRLRDIRTPTITIGSYCFDGSVESVAFTWVLIKVVAALGYVPMDPIYLGRQTSWEDIPCAICEQCRPEASGENRQKCVALLRELVEQRGH
jgi:hypothetical protein